MNSQLVDAQVVRGQVEILKDLVQGHGPFFGMIQHDRVPIRLHLLLYESQQMLLIHARSRVNVRVDLAHIVKVPMWHALLLAHLLELVQHTVQLKLGLEIVQSSITKCFPFLLLLLIQLKLNIILKY
jgi:hypothetical protein